MRVGGSGVQKKEWFYYCTCGPVRLVSDDDVSTSELWSWPGPSEQRVEQRPFEVSPAASSQLISSTCRAKPCHSLSNSIFLPEAMQSCSLLQPQQPQNWNFFFPLDKSWLWDRLLDRNKAKSRFVFHSPMRAGAPRAQFRFLSFLGFFKDNDTRNFAKDERAVTAIKSLVKNSTG